MTKDEALDLALEALETGQNHGVAIDKLRRYIKQARALDKKADNARELGLDYEPVGLIDRLKNPEDHYKFTDPKKANAVLMSLCQEAADALAAPVQEPVAWADLVKAAEQIVKEKFLYKRFIDGTPLANDIPCWMADFAQKYTTSPAAQRQWVGLTDEERDEILDIYITAEGRARAIEAKLKERNT